MSARYEFGRRELLRKSTLDMVYRLSVPYNEKVVHVDQHANFLMLFGLEKTVTAVRLLQA